MPALHGPILVMPTGPVLKGIASERRRLANAIMITVGGIACSSGDPPSQRSRKGAFLSRSLLIGPLDERAAPAAVVPQAMRHRLTSLWPNQTLPATCVLGTVWV
jgi:hypothetical protein